MQALDELMERGTARREKMMKNDCLIDKILVRSHEHGHGGRSVGRTVGRWLVVARERQTMQIVHIALTAAGFNDQGEGGRFSVRPEDRENEDCC